MCVCVCGCGCLGVGVLVQLFMWNSVCVGYVRYVLCLQCYHMDTAVVYVCVWGGGGGLHAYVCWCVRVLGC